MEQTTNKYYHQEEKNLETKKVSQVLSEKVKLQDETCRAIELEEAEVTYQIDNFYAKLFNSNVKEGSIKQGSKLKIKILFLIFILKIIKLNTTKNKFYYLIKTLI
ncbi:MAG: hypothetical protein OHM56_01270 [Spiroplasma phoeniceum]|nr:MAG: hypothetical protein OHM57_00690 [Spiroplasma phoeniceum]UZQ32623.1 MAG: hypothetical protein OHM56_01270 [Spiroplasma phoeniceum]